MATERLPFSAPGAKLEGDREVALQLLPRARELLFQVKQVAATADAPIFSMTRRLEDGSWYRASVYDGIERVRVFGASKESGEESPRREGVGAVSTFITAVRNYANQGYGRPFDEDGLGTLEPASYSPTLRYPEGRYVDWVVQIATGAQGVFKSAKWHPYPTIQAKLALSEAPKYWNFAVGHNASGETITLFTGDGRYKQRLNLLTATGEPTRITLLAGGKHYLASPGSATGGYIPQCVGFGKYTSPGNTLWWVCVVREYSDVSGTGGSMILTSIDRVWAAPVEGGGWTQVGVHGPRTAQRTAAIGIELHWLPWVFSPNGAKAARIASRQFDPLTDPWWGVHRLAISGGDDGAPMAAFSWDTDFTPDGPPRVISSLGGIYGTTHYSCIGALDFTKNNELRVLVCAGTNAVVPSGPAENRTETTTTRQTYSVVTEKAVEGKVFNTLAELTTDYIYNLVTTTVVAGVPPTTTVTTTTANSYTTSSTGVFMEMNDLRFGVHVFQRVAITGGGTRTRTLVEAGGGGIISDTTVGTVTYTRTYQRETKWGTKSSLSPSTSRTTNTPTLGFVNNDDRAAVGGHHDGACDGKSGVMFADHDPWDPDDTGYGPYAITPAGECKSLLSTMPGHIQGFWPNPNTFSQLLAPKPRAQPAE